MLTFKKGSYSREELLVLYGALTDALASMCCAEHGCDECKNRIVCADITRCREYVCYVLDHTAIPKN